MKYKIGQKIEFTESFFLDLAGGGKAKVVKGDQAMVVRKVDDSSGEIVYTTGQASGLSKIIPIQVDDNIDTDYLAKKIMEEL